MNIQQKQLSSLGNSVAALCLAAVELERRGMSDDAQQTIDRALRLNAQRRALKRALAAAQGRSPVLPWRLPWVNGA